MFVCLFHLNNDDAWFVVASRRKTHGKHMINISHHHHKNTHSSQAADTVILWSIASCRNCMTRFCIAIVCEIWDCITVAIWKLKRNELQLDLSNWTFKIVIVEWFGPVAVWWVMFGVRDLPYNHNGICQFLLYGNANVQQVNVE